MTWKLAFFCSIGLSLGGGCGDDGGNGGNGGNAELPALDGPFAVGVTSLSEFYLTAYYPAVDGTGHGHRRYASAALLHRLELTQLAVEPHAELDATPAAATAPRPVLVVGPGGGSYAELSTSLAEHLASHGYVVVLVQPDSELENGDLSGDDADEARAEITGEALRLARRRQLSDALDRLADPITEQLVGRIDLHRIAVGGHSYGGSTAFNASLDDSRIKAAVDLDGALFEQATTTATTVPSVVLMAELFKLVNTPPQPNEPPDVQLGRATIELLRRAPHTTTVALRNAEHYDVTDAAAITSALPASFRLGGTIGPVATSHTNTIVLRFLDAALAVPSRLPAGAELVSGLPSATAEVL